MSFNEISSGTERMFLLDLSIVLCRRQSAIGESSCPRSRRTRYTSPSAWLPLARSARRTSIKTKAAHNFSVRRHQFYAPAPFTPPATTWVALLFHVELTNVVFLHYMLYFLIFCRFSTRLPCFSQLL